MNPITIFVPGIAQPGGSKRAFYIPQLKRAVVTDANAKAKDWKSTVAVFARQAYSGPLLDGALNVTMVFHRPRPKGHYGKKGLKPSAPKHPTSKPDVLKLARSTEDALTGIIWRDDSATVVLTISKVYTEEMPGATITIQPLEEA
jgi:Holliday junction resolvase RusA-like endonuclease